MDYDSVRMFPVEENHTNGSAVENNLQTPILILWNSTCALLSLLLLLPYIPLLRAAWRLPKREILPWILLNFFIITTRTLARASLALAYRISQERFSEWKLPVDIYCKLLLWNLVQAHMAIDITPLVFAMIEIITLRRPGLASKQWLFNSVGFIGTWVVAIGIATPYANLTYISENPCIAVDYDDYYVIDYVERFLFALSVYVVFLLYMSLASQPKWKPSHRLTVEAMVCNLLLFNGSVVTIMTLIVVAISTSGTLHIISGSLLSLADIFWNFNGLIIFCRYKEAREIAREMLRCCWVKCRFQSTN